MDYCAKYSVLEILCGTPEASGKMAEEFYFGIQTTHASLMVTEQSMMSSKIPKGILSLRMKVLFVYRETFVCQSHFSRLF